MYGETREPISWDRFLAQVLRDFAQANNIRLESYSGDWIFRMEKDGIKHFIFGLDLGLNNSASKLIARDKSATFEILHSANVPAVPHHLFLRPLSLGSNPNGNWQSLQQLLTTYPQGLVCKPNIGSSGRNVIRANNQAELEHAVQNIFTTERTLAISPFIAMYAEYRVTVLHNTALHVYKKVKSEFDANIIKEGQDVIIELGIGEVHPELVELVGRLRYRASYGQNALAHTLEVAYLAGLIASQLGGDVILARRAGLFHDIGKALTHEVKGSHVDIGAELCKKHGEHEVVINAIYAHHGHEEPISVESAAVCAADALSAARPGARREVLEAFLKRVEEIEAIATSFTGVINAYAINAGREVRVIVNAELVNDDEAIYLAQKIASEIEERVQYPGEIKVNVIRELRAIEYAR